MDNKYARLFEPITINSMTLKNRIAMSPMGTFTENSDGFLSPRTINYYKARAKGGAGMIITEVQYITNKLDPWLSYISTADTDDQLKSWSMLAEAVHSHGAKLCIQIGCGLGKNAFAFDGDGGDMVSASENPSYYVPGKMCRPMTIKEIQDTVAAYGRAARRCVTAEADAIEIHAHAGYILDQFMTPAWNRRTDQYGGSFENRMRFITEVYHAIRDAVGPNYPILVRMAADHDFKGGRTVEESIEIAQYLEKLGIDAFDIDRGCYEEKKWIVPTPYAGYSCMADGAAKIKAAVSKPVLNSGTHTLDSALESLEQGKLDIVMMGRPLIADPDLPIKAFRGRPEDIRPCLFCNECGARLYQNRYLACAINPQAAAEQDYPIVKTDEPKKIAIVGGGPAGMEAARVAALSGHDVTLYEKSGELGGQLIPASAPEFKKRLTAFAEYEKVQLDKLGVKVVLNKAIDENSPELKDAYKIIVALGATPIIPPIKGIDGKNVVEVTAAHRNPELMRGNAFIIAGGGLSGCDTAVDLARKGKDVTIVEMRDTIAPDVWNVDNRNPLLFELRDHNVKVLTGHKITEFTDHGVIARTSSGETVELSGDMVISAFGMRSESALAKKICDKYTTAAIAVGDCDKIGQVIGAVRNGFFAGWSIQ